MKNKIDNWKLFKKFHKVLTDQGYKLAIGYDTARGGIEQIYQTEDGKNEVRYEIFNEN